MGLLLPSLLVSMIVVFTLERSTAKKYLGGVGFGLGLSLALSSVIGSSSPTLWQDILSGAVLYTVIMGLALLFQVYVNAPGRNFGD